MILLCISLLVAGAAANAVNRTAGTDRDGKLFSVFQIIRFANDPCTSASGGIGSCYTDAECTTKGGATDGNCASGFGVCCVGVVGGGSGGKCQNTDLLVKLNNSRIESPAFPGTVLASGCNSNTPITRQAGTVVTGSSANYKYDIQKSSAAIVQIRLEFLKFEIDAPEAGQCANSTISISGVDSATSMILPTNLCGVLTGQAIYLSVKNTPLNGNVTVKIQLGDYGTQRWSILVQYLEASDDVAPTGCLQYFRTQTGLIKSFNADAANPELLVDHSYMMCIKLATNNCEISYNSVTFQMGGTGGSCAATDPKIVIGASSYCGDTFGAVTSMMNMVSVMTGTENAAMNGGFSISYLQLPCPT